MNGIIEPSPLSNQAISDYAERVGTHHQIYNAAGRADVQGLLRAIGGRVEQSHDPFGPEALTVFKEGDFSVHLPPMTSSRRDRFTIAHEIGHYFLHYLYPGYQGMVRFGRGQSNRTETQANVFASSLLMPASAFRAACNQHGKDWWTVAEIFDVSPSAASVRAQVLGLN